MIRRWHFIVLVVATIAGCSSSKPAKDDGNFYLAAFEDFESEEHPDVVPPLPPTETGHSFPKALERVNEPRRQEGRGYRVQLYASRDKSEADAELQRVFNWWELNRKSASGTDSPPIYVEYEQPFFKVRLGDYRSRPDAASDAQILARSFRGAFVVPATINLR